MSNFTFAYALTTGATVAALTTGILTISIAAYAHGVGNQTGGGGVKGVPTITTSKITTTKSMDHNHWRHQLIDPGYVRRTVASTGVKRPCCIYYFKLNQSVNTTIARVVSQKTGSGKRMGNSGPHHAVHPCTTEAAPSGQERVAQRC
jgi:hypothetical protein